MIYTQNIDGLEKDAGLDPDKILYIHGLITRDWWCTNNRSHTLPFKDVKEKFLKFPEDEDKNDDDKAI